MSDSEYPPIHPGEVLLEEFIKPLRISQYRLAKDVSVHPRRINQIVHGKRVVTADTALRLCRYFGTSERFWLCLQSGYYLEVEKERLKDRLAMKVRVFAPKAPAASCASRWPAGRRNPDVRASVRKGEVRSTAFPPADPGRTRRVWIGRGVPRC